MKSWGTCIAVLYSAILKLSYQSNPATVYRGVDETYLHLPPEFLGLIFEYFDIINYYIIHIFLKEKFIKR